MAYFKPGREPLLIRATVRKKTTRQRKIALQRKITPRRKVTRRRKDDVAGLLARSRAAGLRRDRHELKRPSSLDRHGRNRPVRVIRGCGRFHSARFGRALRAEACSTFLRCFDTVARLGLSAKRATAPGRILA